MRITVCCKRFGAAGGAETFLSHFVRCLVNDGHQVRVLAAQLTEAAPGVECTALRLPPVPKALQDWVLARASRKALAAQDADVTFSDQKCWGAQVVRPGGGVQREYVRQRMKAYPPGVRRGARRAAYALSVRERLRIRIDDRLWTPGPRLVIANSDMVRRDLVRYYPHLEGRVRVVYNGTDTDRFHPRLRQEYRAPVRRRLGVPEGAFVAVFVGTGWRRKGLSTLIEALGLLRAQLSGPRVFAVVVGSGNVRQALAAAARHGVAEFMRFTGPVEPDPYYGAADVLVLPTFFDPCANVTVEALACALPVVTSARNGASEMLQPGVNGAVVADAADALGIAQAVRQFTDEDHRRRAGASARALALRYTLAGQHRRLMDAVASLAGAD
jgi:UDP-glucose:(heptosyl)LPS alpha-1,3-glucosyltransferase